MRGAHGGTSPGTRRRRGRRPESPQKSEHLGPMLVVEAFERGDRHGFIILVKRPWSPICEHGGMRAAVVGHIEWLEFVPVEAVPRPGEIVHADESWEQAAGGGSAAAVQLTKLADSVDFFTALGNDEHARLAREELEARGITVHATAIDAPSAAASHSSTTPVSGRSRRSVASSIRAATTTGFRGTSSLAATLSTTAQATPTHCWRLDVRASSLRRHASSRRRGKPRWSRRARLEREGRSRALPARADRSRAEARRDDFRTARWVGAAGWAVQRCAASDESADAYGAGDCFAAGLAFGLAAGLEGLEALDFAARCGAGALAGPGVHAEAIPLP